MPARRLSKAALATALVTMAALGAACAMPGPSPNEINMADEGMSQGAAAARGLTMVALDEVEIGKSINEDKTIKDEADSFQPKDTVYASIRVSGKANSGLVRAMWSDERGQSVQDDTRIVSPSRGEVVTLQISKPQGLAGGRYRVDIFLDNRLVQSKTFSVEGAPAAEGAPSTNPTNH
jgi:hypothetical protein